MIIFNNLNNPKLWILLINKYLIILSSFTSDVVVFESNYTRNLFVIKYKQKNKKIKFAVNTYLINHDILIKNLKKIQL